MKFTYSYINSTFQQIFLAGMLLLVMVSCRKEIDLELRTNDKRFLVDAEFTNQPAIHTVKLNRTGSLLNDNPIIPVSGAKVYITDGYDTIYFTETIPNPGLYQSNSECFGIGGKTYTLSISEIDIDEDGKLEKYTASSKMPVPVIMDSLKSERGIHSGDKTEGINNYAYFRATYDGPDYIYKYMKVNNLEFHTLSNRLGSGEIARFESEFKINKPVDPASVTNIRAYLQVSQSDITVKEGDVLTFICLNYTSDCFQFLKEFDNNTSYDWINDNFYDQIKMPKNLPTNISPSNKAAGYFMVFSVSRIYNIMHN